MNKHMIILPVLLTSAVSLHVLSYNLEDTPEIVQNSPIPMASSSTGTGTESQTPETTTPSNPDKVAVNVNVNQGKNVQPSNSKPSIKPSVQASATTTSANPTPAPVATPSVVSTPTPSPSGQTIQVATGLIPTKSFGEIVKEAKQVGGRVDPFLSMRPPEMQALPELPSPPPTAIASNNNLATIPNKGAFKGIPNTMTKIPKPPTAYIPSFEELPKSGSNKNNGKPNINGTKPTNNNAGPDKDSIVFNNTVKIEQGLQLTGIITGRKPFALIKVDNESKVFSIGDIIRPDGRIKLVSINFENQSVTISDNKNRKARLEINS